MERRISWTCLRNKLTNAISFIKTISSIWCWKTTLYQVEYFLCAFTPILFTCACFRFWKDDKIPVAVKAVVLQQDVLKLEVICPSRIISTYIRLIFPYHLISPHIGVCQGQYINIGGNYWESRWGLGIMLIDSVVLLFFIFLFGGLSSNRSTL